MSAVFLKVVNMSISAGWIVLAVLVLRLALKKAPKWASVLLWGLVALRLVCPFSFESALSLIPSDETVSLEIMTEAQPHINSGVPIINDAVNPIIGGIFAPSVVEYPNPGLPDAPAATDPPVIPGTDIPAVTDSANPLQIWIPVFAGIWLVGVAAMLIYMVISYCRVRSRVKTAVLHKENIYRCETVVSPFILGVWRPKIYLPFYLSERDMAYVVAHEQAHLHRKDHLWKPFGFVLLSVYWFNPLLWPGYILLCRDIELACDEKVVQKLDTPQRADYSEALLNCSVNRRLISACPLAFGEVGIRQRIKSVLNYKKPAFWVVLMAVVALIVASVCLLTDPLSQKQEAPNEEPAVTAPTDTTEPTTPTVPANPILSDHEKALFAVLENERQFVYGENAPCYLRDFVPDTFNNTAYEPQAYAFWDLDLDGENELILHGAPEGYAYLILHMENDQIYGYTITHRGFQQPRDNGVFQGSGGATLNAYCTISFQGSSHTVTTVAKFFYSGEDSKNNVFEIGGKAVSYDEIRAYVDDWNSRPTPEWTDYTPAEGGAALVVPENLAEVRRQLVSKGKTFAIIALGSADDYNDCMTQLETGYYGTKYPFLSQIPQSQFVSAGDGKITFAIIPVDEHAEVTVHKWVSTDGANTFHKGEQLYSGKGEPIIVQCNFSDIFRDSLVTVSGVEIKPDTDNNEGKVVIPEAAKDKVLDLTSYSIPQSFIGLQTLNANAKNHFAAAFTGAEAVYLKDGTSGKLADCATYGGKVGDRQTQQMAYIDFDGDGVVEVLLDYGAYGNHILHYDFREQKLYATYFTPIGGCVFFANGEYWNNETSMSRCQIKIFNKGRAEFVIVTYTTAPTTQRPAWTKVEIGDSASAVTPVKQENLAYTEFLYGQSYAVDAYDSVTIAELNRNPTIDYSGEYTLFDMNQDGTPELFVRTTTCLYILTYRQEQLVLLTSLTYTTLLNNGHLYYRRDGGGPPNVNRYYIIPALSEDGTYSDTRVHFAEYHPEGSDRYMIDGEDVTKEEYDRMVEKVEQIGNDEILWTALPTITA